MAKSKLSYNSDPPPALYGDAAFILYSPKEEPSLYPHYDLENILRNWLVEKTRQAPEQENSYADYLLNSDSTTLLSLGLSIVIRLPEKYADLFYGRSVKANFWEEFNYVGNEYFHYSVLEALQLCFPFFTAQQKCEVADRILHINPKQEYRFWRQNNAKSFSPIGRTQYLLINALPPEFVEQNFVLKRRYQELIRKFGPYQHKEPEGFITIRGGTILQDQTYERMNEEDWLNSFLAYDERKGKQWWNGVDELSHARKFTVEVSKNPERFINLIKKIIDHVDVPQLYIYHGLEGLKEAMIDLATFKELFLRSVQCSHEQHFQTRIVWLTDYFIKQDIYDKDVFAFLVHVALHGSEDDNSNAEAPLSRGINQPKGAAIWRLIQFAQNSSFVDSIFDTLEEVAKKATVSTRATAIRHQAFLNKYYPLRSVNLFIALCQGYEEELASVSITSLQYNIHIDFRLLIPFFKTVVVANSALHKLTQILMVAYKYNYPESERLLEQYLSLGEETISGALKVALHGMQEQNLDVRSRCEKVAYRYLNSEQEKVTSTYEHAFNDFGVEDFEVLFTFIETYSGSTAGRFRGRTFYEYLLKCVRDFPDKCILIAASFDTHELPD